MRIALVVTTHERPDALAAVLDTIARQSEPPQELIVTDDGSGPATRAVIEAFAQNARYPIRHVWQPHEGFRAARARNAAVAATSGDYIVFVDGDMLLHPEFLADHRRAARPGRWIQGLRIPLDDAATAAALASDTARTALAERRVGFPRRPYALRMSALAPADSAVANLFVAVKACNLAAWRTDLDRINGFDERFVGWGPEDKDLAARLGRAGCARRTLIFGGLAWHLAHPPATRDCREANEALFRTNNRARLVSCPTGIEAHRTTA
jgi:glycosyltransferase involved in cell wall biosynthesis